MLLQGRFLQRLSLLVVVDLAAGNEVVERDVRVLSENGIYLGSSILVYVSMVKAH